MLTTIDASAVIAGASSLEDVMRIKLLKNTVCAGVMARAGDLLDAPEKDANYLIGLGFAEIAADPEPVIVKGKKNA